jgi:hypothetical protein
MTTLQQLATKIKTFKSFNDSQVKTYLGKTWLDISSSDTVNHDFIAIVWNGETPLNQLSNYGHVGEIEDVSIYVKDQDDVIESGRLLARELSGYAFEDDLNEWKHVQYINTSHVIGIGDSSVIELKLNII